MIESRAEIGITPSAVAAYLGSTGWSLVQDDETRQNWVSEDSPRAGTVLLLPKDPSFEDYDDVFLRALRRLERLNDWDTQELYTRILSARSDVLYIRAEQYTTDGTIPIREAQQLLAGAVEMVTAAARWTLDPRGAYGGRMPDAVKGFVDDDLRMGHTQHGSFVITVVTRLDPPVGDSGIKRTVPGESDHAKTPTKVPTASEVALRGHAAVTDGTLAPFPRQVMTSLVLGLAQAQRLTNDARSTPLSGWTMDVEEAVSQGVTAQLCQALGDMAEQPGVQGLDLSFNWAHAEPSPPPAVDQFSFDRPAVPILRNMRERLATKPPQPRVAHITGYVTRLERGADAEEGTVTVVGHLENGQERQVRVPLTGTAYAEAVQAHESRRLVEAVGEMVREGRVYFLRNNPTVRRLTSTAGPEA